MRNTKEQAIRRIAVIQRITAIEKIAGIIALAAVIGFLAGCASMKPPAFAGTYEKDKYRLVITGEADPFEYTYMEDGVNATKGTLTFSLSTATEKAGIGMSNLEGFNQIEGALLTLIDEYKWDGGKWVAIDPVAVTYNYTWFFNTGKLFLSNGTDWPFLEGTWEKWLGK